MLRFSTDWAPRSQTLLRLGVGHPEEFITILKLPGTYEYCLVVDGCWIPDPRTRETVLNPFGGINSILKVADSPEAAHLADAEALPLKNANKQKSQRI